MAIQHNERNYRRTGGRDHERHRRNEADSNAERLAKGLGWFSIGLGLAQIAAPREMAHLIGIRGDDENQSLMRAVGLRELASGIGILSRDRPAGWVWARVGGDMMDLSLLGGAFASDDTRKDRVALATAAVVGVTALDLMCGQRLLQQQFGASDYDDDREWMEQRDSMGHARRDRDRAFHVVKSITVNRPAEELYGFWHDFENLPRFMDNLESVKVTGDKRSHWKAKAPAGMTVEWDAEVTDDQPNRRIAWRSLAGADVDNDGSVSFLPATGNRGTVVRVEMRYDPPGDAIGVAFAKLFGKAPDQQAAEHLRSFKQIMETGDVTRSEASLGWIRHPAQPSARLQAARNPEYNQA